jgi:1-acyl-sn-glycerol-3-phosphate acyltransferase
VVSVQQLVALGMTGYVRANFRVQTFGLERLALEPSTIIAPNHRSDNDVPLLVTALAPRWSRAATHGVPWPTFAADDHAFFRGFLAGYPEGIPLGLRRALWPVRVGGVLERHLQCVPVRHPAQMRLVELLRHDPERQLDGQLPPEVREALARRAQQLGRPAPGRGAEALNAGYADILWTELDRDRTPGVDELWRTHLRCAVADFRRLIATVRGGGLVIIFPEGELKTEGEVGPLAPGLASLARRGRARQVQPVAISYDPLTAGRPRAYVSVGPSIEPTPGRLIGHVTEGLRRAIPLTAGQIAATVLCASPTSTAATLVRAGDDWVARAQAERRPAEPRLLRTRRERERLLTSAFRHAQRRGPTDQAVRSLARELAGANPPP